MKSHTVLLYSLVAALALLSATACVTSSDLQRVADSVGKLEAVAADTSNTTEQVQAQVAETQSEIGAVAHEVEERTDGFIKGLDEGAEGGLIGIGAALLLNLYRNSTRKKLVAQVEAGEKVAV